MIPAHRIQKPTPTFDLTMLRAFQKFIGKIEAKVVPNRRKTRFFSVYLPCLQTTSFWMTYANIASGVSIYRSRDFFRFSLSRLGKMAEELFC